MSLGMQFVLIAVALSVLIGLAHTAIDNHRTRRRARRLRTGPSLSLPRQERTR